MNRRAASGQSESIPQLLRIAQTLRLTGDPRFLTALEGIMRSGNDRAARKYAQALEPAYARQMLNPDPFHSIETDLDGPWRLGVTISGRLYGLHDDELFHTLISGSTGTGKTTIAANLVRQAQRRGRHVFVMDRKNDYAHAAREGMLSIPFERFRLNPICPPAPGVNISEFLYLFAKMLADLLQLMQRGASITVAALDATYRRFNVYERWPSWDWERDTFPTVSDLLSTIRSREFAKRIKGRGNESLFSLSDKLQSLCIQLGPVIHCRRGFDLAKLLRAGQVVALCAAGLSAEAQNFLNQSLLHSYCSYFRTYGPRGTMNLQYMTEEAKAFFGKQHSENFTVADVTAQVREAGIALIALDQSPSELTQALFSNLGTLIILRHSDGNDLRRIRYAAGLTPEQVQANYSLQPGQAMVRSVRKRDVHLIQVPYTPVDKFITREEWDFLIEPKLKKLYEDVIPVKESSAEMKVEKTILDLDEAERDLLECIARYPDHPSSYYYEAVGLSSSAGHRKKTILVKRGFLSQIRTNLGVGGRRALYLVPNPLVLEELGIDPGPGRGGRLHKHFQAGLKARAEKLGFAAVIEEGLDTPEAVDLGLDKEGERIAVEICVTSKPATEVANIEKAFRLGFDRIVFCFVNTKVLRATRRLATKKYPAETLSRVRFCLVHHFEETIGGH